MKFNSFLFIFLTSFIVYTNYTFAVIEPKVLKFQNTEFDAVSKKIIFKGNIPDYVQSLTEKWFNENVKVNGFEGSLVFVINNFMETRSNINDGKKINISMDFRAIISKPTLSQKKYIDGKVSSFGSLTGNFSLNEFDQLVINTYSDLVMRLSRDLKTKI